MILFQLLGLIIIILSTLTDDDFLFRWVVIAILFAIYIKLGT